MLGRCASSPALHSAVGASSPESPPIMASSLHVFPLTMMTGSALDASAAIAASAAVVARNRSSSPIYSSYEEWARHKRQEQQPQQHQQNTNNSNVKTASVASSSSASSAPIIFDRIVYISQIFAFLSLPSDALTARLVSRNFNEALIDWSPHLWRRVARHHNLKLTDCKITMDRARQRRNSNNSGNTTNVSNVAAALAAAMPARAATMSDSWGGSMSAGSPTALSPFANMCLLGDPRSLWYIRRLLHTFGKSFINAWREAPFPSAEPRSLLRLSLQQPAVVELLLEAGANPVDEEGNDLLMSLVSSASLSSSPAALANLCSDTVRALAADKRTLLSMFNPRTGMAVMHYLAMGSRAALVTAVLSACSNQKRLELLSCKTRNAASLTPLHISCACESVDAHEVTTAMLTSLASCASESDLENKFLDSRGETPIHALIRAGNARAQLTVVLSVSNVSRFWINKHNSLKQSPLDVAFGMGDGIAVEILLGAGAECPPQMLGLAFSQ